VDGVSRFAEARDVMPAPDGRRRARPTRRVKRSAGPDADALPRDPGLGIRIRAGAALDPA